MDLFAATKFFECRWKPNCWELERRFIFVRTRKPIQRKEPVQLSLFASHEYGYEKRSSASGSTIRLTVALSSLGLRVLRPKVDQHVSQGQFTCSGTPGPVRRERRDAYRDQRHCCATRSRCKVSGVDSAMVTGAIKHSSWNRACLMPSRRTGT
jgi:hypothetical protein